MKKKLLPLLLCCTLLAACGDNDSKSVAAETPTPTKAVVSEMPSRSDTTVDPLTALQDCLANGRSIPSEAALPEGVSLSPEFLEQALVRNGNTSRLRDVMLKASKGKEITLAYLGGSITAGSNASPMESACWAAQTTEWWRNTFPLAKINYVNAGIGATDSYVGVHRVEQEILQYHPDVVVVEFSVNDTKSLNVETYESLLRRLLESESRPAVVPLMLCTAGSTFAADHAPLAILYDLPIIAYFNLFGTGMLAWDQAGDSDGVHPKNEGHAVISALMCSFYETVLEELVTDAENRGLDTVSQEAETERSSAELPEGQTPGRYEDASFIYADNAADLKIESEGFVPMDSDGPILHGKGWVTKEAGSFSFECEARTIGFAYLRSDASADPGPAVYDVYADDTLICSIDLTANITGSGPLQYCEILKEDRPALHKVRLVPSEDNSGMEFTILGLALGK
ncbi:MAG: SGNH/GDSL hydrolase family protein [Lachnospiraceae bacterium]|nr:SGNH/GDSL hydrolase family protein [Lachnospiraceae bacterium]